MPGELFHYFVEGDCEKSFVNALIHNNKGEYRFFPGKIEVFNVVTQRISSMKAMSIKKGTKIVFIYDTDVKTIDIFESNIDILEKYANINPCEIIFIPSVRKFEEELVRSCEDIKNINDLLGTKGIDEFKKKFINHKDIVSKLISVGFDIKKLWVQTPDGLFEGYGNKSKQIREKINDKVSK